MNGFIDESRAADFLCQSAVRTLKWRSIILSRIYKPGRSRGIAADPYRIKGNPSASSNTSHGNTSKVPPVRAIALRGF
jgi:hypothetical protein